MTPTRRAAALAFGIGLLSLLMLSTSPAETPAVSDRSVQPPASWIGHSARVHFRGSDDVSPPGGGVGKLSWLTGKIVSLPPGAIELELQGSDQVSRAWIPIASVAYVALERDRPATTQP